MISAWLQKADRLSNAGLDSMSTLKRYGFWTGSRKDSTVAHAFPWKLQCPLPPYAHAFQDLKILILSAY